MIRIALSCCGLLLFAMTVFSQNFGIGTASPAAKLHVSAGNVSYALFGPNSSWNSYLYVGAGPNTISSGRAQVISTNGNLHLDAGIGQHIYVAYYNSNNTFINAQGGNVGIRTTAPTEALDVNGNIKSSSLAGSSVHLAVDANGVIKKLTQAYASGYNQANGADVGVVRSMTFTKQEADTKVRISYTDNLRTYGHAQSCRWRFLINGSDCPSGTLAYDFYVLNNNNLHRSRTLVGVCGNFGAGTHTLQVYVESSPGYSGADCYTGWQGSWMLEAQEIY